MDFVVVVSGWVIQVVHHPHHPPYRAAIYIHALILHSLRSRFLPMLLPKTEEGGAKLDLSTLRTFRVLRPLKLVSGVPSKFFLSKRSNSLMRISSVGKTSVAVVLVVVVVVELVTNPCKSISTNPWKKLRGATVWWGSPLLARPLTLVDSFGTEPICTTSTCGLRKMSSSAF